MRRPPSFEGFPKYVEQAAHELGKSIGVGEVRAIIPLTAVASLCAQASDPSVDRFEEVLRMAEGFRDRLEVARLAADRMIADVRSQRANQAPPPVPVPVPVLVPPSSPRGRRR